MSYILTILEYEDPDNDMKSRLVPAVKHPETGEIFKGKRGDDHSDILIPNHDLRKALMRSKDPEAGYHHLGFHDPKTNKFYPKSSMNLDSPSLMTKVQRFRKYGTESLDILEDTDLKYRAVPSVRHPETGKFYVGTRSQDHFDLVKKNPDLMKSFEDAHKAGHIHWTKENFHYYDPKTKKQHLARDYEFDSPSLMTRTQRFRKYGTENQEDNMIHRLQPAVMHPETGKIYKGVRGQIHAAIVAQNPDLNRAFEKALGPRPNWPESTVKWADNHEKVTHELYGFHDPKTKEFFPRKKVPSLDSTDLMTPVQRAKLGYFDSLFERMDISTPEGAAALRHLVPAFIHPDTGKMYVGRKGDTHNDIIDRHSIDPIHKDRFDPHDRGFYHTLNKTFISKAASGLDSSDLMTRTQRMRKLSRENLLRLSLNSSIF